MANPDEVALWRAIQETPIIDNHAHPLLNKRALEKYPLLAIATEAHGAALETSRQTLAHLRAVEQLSGILNCDSTWEAVRHELWLKRNGDGYAGWIKRCLAGIECVLVDDGLDSLEDAEGYGFFDKFTRSESKRIVRIEPLAAEIIEEQCMQEGDVVKALEAVKAEFVLQIVDAIEEADIVGFKSVICYRTGLAIPREKDCKKAQEVFSQIHRQRRAEGAKEFKRLDHHGLNEWFVHLLAQTINETTSMYKKPIQFHTGLGDNDMTLTKSSPAHMQDFIEAYPNVPIVLLHAGYPFTRELGYLAAMYANAYADIGEVFPFLSRDGQESVVRQVLELCPSAKVLWSTDGHWFPETYLLAVEQVREVLWNVLRAYVQKGDLTSPQAVQLVKDVLFNNSNKLYGLGLEHKKLSDSPDESTTDSFATVTPGGRSEAPPSSAVLSRFLDGRGEEPRFLRVYWSDMTGTPRLRAIPIRRVKSMLGNGEELSFGVTKASMGLTQADMPAAGVSPSGEYRLHPDLSTLLPGAKPGYIVARGDFKESDGTEVALCPRSVLKRTLETARSKGLAFTLGFEVELVLMRRGNETKYEPLDGDGHIWSVARAMDHHAYTEVIEEAIALLDEAGVHIEMVHPESANGQYEIVLPKAPALEAVDTLLYARDVISSCATAKGYKMTLHPKPFAMACGTAAHVHMSISSLGGSHPATYEPFYAGILQHLRAVSAFTYSSPASYERAQDGCWAGGTWIAWGTQNRETPLRKVEGSHWELKCMDGVANPYLALSAILAAGILGYGSNEELTWQDCGNAAPAALSESEQGALGVTTKIPGSLDEALGALREDKELCRRLGDELVERYVAVKRVELQLTNQMEDEEKRMWIMERY